MDAVRGFEIELRMPDLKAGTYRLVFEQVEELPVATFNFFDIFGQNVGRGVHNLHSNTLKVMLTNTAPVATNSVKADITEISAGSGYTAGGVALSNQSFTQTAGVGRLTADDPVFAADGGDIGPFRYAVLYDDTPSSPADPLIAWWDYGSVQSITDGSTKTIDLPSTRLVFQI